MADDEGDGEIERLVHNDLSLKILRSRQFLLIYSFKAYFNWVFIVCRLDGGNVESQTFSAAMRSLKTNTTLTEIK